MELSAPGSIGEWEKLEGMLVTIPQALVDRRALQLRPFRRGRADHGRQDPPTAVLEPGSRRQRRWPSAVRSCRIRSTTGATLNPGPVRHPDGGLFDLGTRFRGGDSVGGVTGVLDFAFGVYRIQPTRGADSPASTNPRPDGPEGSVATSRRSFNVLNYFTTLDGRGANTAEEFERQRTKIIAAITEIDADVVGPDRDREQRRRAIHDLVARLNEATARALRLHRHRRDRHGRDQGRVRLQAGHA